jgi:excisionase family DNA binding protein
MSAIATRSKLTVEDVAAYLRVSTWTIWDWARKGEIPHRKPPGKRRLLFDLRELEAWQDGAQLERKRWGQDGRIVRPTKVER